MRDFSDFRKMVIANSDSINKTVSDKIALSMENTSFENSYDNAVFQQRVVAYQCALAMLEAYHEWLNLDG